MRRDAIERLANCAAATAFVGVAAAGVSANVKLRGDDSRPADLFGDSVAIAGDVAIVGSYHDDADDVAANGGLHGSAYLFDSITGRQLAKLTADDATAGDCFGVGVAVDARSALVGSNFDDNSGSAYLFDLATHRQQYKLKPSDGAAGDRFGERVLLREGVALISSPHAAGHGAEEGAVYVFDPSSGQQRAKLSPADGAAGDHFGGSLSLDAGRMLVGASDRDGVGRDSGSSYLFDVDTGVQLAKFEPQDAHASQQFGSAVALDGDVALIGSYFDAPDGIGSGSAYVFDVSTGQQLRKLVPADAEVGDAFGLHVALAGNIALISAPGDGDRGASLGSVYVFDINTGAQIAKLTAADVVGLGGFGSQVALDGRRAIIGAFLDQNIGAAYLVDVPEPLALSAGLMTMCLLRRRGHQGRE